MTSCEILLNAIVRPEKKKKKYKKFNSRRADSIMALTIAFSNISHDVMSANL
jgi:hypothetical protein